MSFDFGRAVAAQGKALGPIAAFMDPTTPVSIYAPGKSRQDAVISQREAGRHAQAYGGNQAIDWVYDCIGLYTDPASSAEYRLVSADGGPLTRAKTPGTPPDHSLGPKTLYDLLDKPNPFMLYDELISLLVIDLMLVGNAYWFKWQVTAAGQPLALYRLCPSHVKIIPGPYGPQRYEYQPPGQKDKLDIDPANVIHFRRPNPHSAYYGMGIIQGAGRAMDLELAITDTMASYYENKAEPSLIVQSDRRVPRDVFNKLRMQLRSRMSGSDKAGEMLLLESGLKASSLSRSAADSLFKELSVMSRDRIFGKFRASPMLFGFMDQTGGGSNKVSDVRREFDNSALRPFLGRLSTQISVGLTSAWGVKYQIDHRSVLPADEALKVAESLAAAPGVKIREVRRAYAQFGIPESTGDQKIDEFVLNKPGPNADANGNVVDPITGKVVASATIGAANRNLGGQAGRPPKGQNVSGFGTAKTKGGKSLGDLMAELAGKAVAGNTLTAALAPDDAFGAARAADVNAAAALIHAVLKDAATQLERDLLDHVEGKALKTSDLVARVRNSPAWATFRATVERGLRDGIVSAASSGVMHSGLTPPQEIDYDTLADGVLLRKEGLSSIVKTLKERVVARVKAARSADAERHEFNAEIQDVINNWTTSQATMIAETEAVHGYNEATLTAAELSGVTHVYVTDGNDNDEPCAEADGSTWEIAHARENRLEHPRCRRAFIPLVPATNEVV